MAVGSLEILTMPWRAGHKLTFRPRRWLAALLLTWLTATFAQPDSEPQLEAAYLANFMKYVEWPAASRTTATICLFGRDTLGSYLAAYEGRTVGGRELRIRRVYGPDEMPNCQLVFIPDVEEARIGAVLKWSQGMSILTVSDAEGFARLGGGIELVRNAGRVQFIVNADTLARNTLKPGSQMMRLALRVLGSER